VKKLKMIQTIKDKYYSHPTVADNRGMALVITLLMMLQLSLMGWGAQTVSITNQKIVGNYRKQALAFNMAESGIQVAIANLKHDILWNRSSAGSSGESSTETIDISGTNGSYTVTVFDSSDDTTLGGGIVKLVSRGTYSGSTQQIELQVAFSPDPGSAAGSPTQAVVTEGDNVPKGGSSHIVNGYDENGCCESGFVSYDPTCADSCEVNYMIETFQDLSVLGINEDALKAFKDFTIIGNLTSTSQINNISDFWENESEGNPYITYVTGDMTISGSQNFYGIFFVEGNVTLSGSVRIDGVIYAPNTTVVSEINGGGSPGDQPVEGQILSGAGGVQAAGNHADVQYVSDYVDAFNNLSGQNVNVNNVDGTWRQI